MMIEFFLIMNGDGDEIPSDAIEEALAFNCEDCDYPILASSVEGKPGSALEKSAICKGCGTGYFLDVRTHAKKIYVFRTDAF